MTTINEKALYELFKNQKGMRVRENARNDLRDILNNLSEEMVKKAAVLARKGRRTTIMPRDIKKAKKSIIGKEKLTVGEMSQQVEKLSAVQLSKLAGKVRKQAEKVLKP
jgi:histone H3/H4